MSRSALAHLAWLQINSPMLFELQNGAANRISHCGVLEFTAKKGMIYMPYWMMENRLLSEGNRVRVKPAMLPKGTYVKLQLHTKDFLDISNPKAILEAKLRNFSCLTTGDSIMVAYDNKKYYIDVVETRPSNAISIIETDCDVDFAPPLDYKEPEKPAVSSPSKPPAKVEEAQAETVLKFIPFTGIGRRLGGKPIIHKLTAVAPSSKDKHPAAAESSKQSASASTLHGITRKQEKLILDSKGNLITKDSSKEPERESKREEPKKEEPPNFQPFTSNKYSLMD